MASLPLRRLVEVVAAEGESSRFRFGLRPRRGIAFLSHCLCGTGNVNAKLGTLEGKV